MTKLLHQIYIFSNQRIRNAKKPRDGAVRAIIKFSYTIAKTGKSSILITHTQTMHLNYSKINIRVEARGYKSMVKTSLVQTNSTRVSAV